MLRNVRLADVEGFFEVAHALYALREVFEYLDTRGMGYDFQQFYPFCQGDHLFAFRCSLYEQ